ncbi:hypothetical protein ACHAXS_000449 [Conticribra weissflogii]
MKIRKGMYGLPKASALANPRLKKRLSKYCSYKVPYTPGPPKDSLYPAPTKKHGANQDPISEDTTKDLSKDKKNQVQQVVVSIL